MNDKKLVNSVSSETYPIKCDETCNRCKWGFDNDCSKYECCHESCPHTIDEHGHCKCGSVTDDAPCPYFEEVTAE